MATALHAEPLGFTPRWPAGTEWQLVATYRQIQGGWSDPIVWDFRVEGESEGRFLVTVAGNAATRAQLSFDKNSNQLIHALLTDRLRGEELVRDMSFDGSTPVYPLFSIIPFHTPVFSNGSSTSTHRLTRQIDGRLLGVEELAQSVRSFDREELFSAWPDPAREAWAGAELPRAGLKVEVTKKGVPLFEQFWFPDLSWALYTEAKGCKAWLAR